jgi:ribosomal protein S18 acetylase RimI-like enzyme
VEQINVKIVEYNSTYAADTVRMWRESKEKAIGQRELHTFEEHVYFLDNILNKDNKIYIAIDVNINKVVGILAFNENEINQLYIHNDYQGMKLGINFLDFAKMNSGGSLTLYTFDINRDAQRFYEKNGFKAIGRGNDNEEKLEDIKYKWVACYEK